MDQENQAIADSCARVVTEFCHSADKADGDAVAALFTAEGEWISGRKTVSGSTAIAQHFSTGKAGLILRHLTGPSRVQVEGPDKATAVTYYVVFMGETGEGSVARMELPFSMGEWHDSLVRTPLGWRISRHEVKRLLQRAPQS